MKHFRNIELLVCVDVVSSVGAVIPVEMFFNRIDDFHRDNFFAHHQWTIQNDIVLECGGEMASLGIWLLSQLFRIAPGEGKKVQNGQREGSDDVGGP